MSEVIVVTSGKGGVGKTTVAANLGCGLALLGNKVVLIDTDIGLRNLDVVMGLDSGADDYIPKPFRMMELISRIKAALRRAEDKGVEEYRLENLYVSPMKHVVMVDQEPVSLTLKEYEMLCLLLKNSGMVLSRTQLLNQIWGYEFDGESRTVDVHIRTLRQKLGTAGDLIETVRGVGYKIGK